MITPSQVRPASQDDVLLTPGYRTLTRQPHSPNLSTYQSSDGLIVISSYDLEGHGELFHLSVSRKARVPNWTEMIDVWRAFEFDNPMMILPNWTKHRNDHNFCLHFYAIPPTWSQAVSRAVLEAGFKPQNTKKPPPTPAGPVRLVGQSQRITYKTISAYRTAHYSPLDDVLVFFDIQRRSYASDVFLMKTPEPWLAGEAV